MENFDQKTKDLFDLNINPNIDELIEKETEEIPEPEEELVIEPVKNKNSHIDVFEEVNNDDLKKSSQLECEIKPKKQKQKLETIPEESEIESRPTYREKKKLERQRQKEIEKLEKEKIRKARREETAERNRQKARDRYWEKKKEKEKKIEEEDKKIKERIAMESKSKLNNFQKREINQKINKPNNLDFAQFTEYMIKYENLKQTIKQQKEQEEQNKSPFPANYPIHLLYNNRSRSRNNFF